MPGRAAKIMITECQPEILRRLGNSVTAPSRLRQRAKIILLAFEGTDNQDIVRDIGLERHQVGRWRLRWAAAFNRLVLIECTESAATTRRAIEKVHGPGEEGYARGPEAAGSFLSDPNHRIRFVDIPEHSSWLNQIEVVFGMIMRKVIRRGSFKSVSDLCEKLLKFSEYFNRVFAKPFRWTYTVRPLSCRMAA